MKFLLLLALLPLDLYPNAPREFAWHLPLHDSPEPLAYAGIPLPRDVRAHSLHFPNDLRILDDTGTAWPFFLHKPEPAPSVPEPLPARRLNELHVEGPGGYRQLDLLLEEPRRPHTRLHLDTTGTDFVRRVEVLASDDRQTWGLIATGYLIRTDTPARIRETTLRYPPNTLPHLRIRIYPNTRNASETFTITAARPEHLPPASQPELTEHPLTRLPAPNTAPEPGIQQLHLDLGLPRQPFQSIELTATGRDHLRRVNVYTRNEPGDPWQPCGGGDIYRIGSLTQTRLPVRGQGRYLRLDILNRDDPPLDIDTLRVLHRTETLITQVPANPGTPALYFGSETAAAPRYDLQSRWNRLSPPPPLHTLQPGDLQPNPAHRPPLSPGLLNTLSLLLVAATSALVLWIIYRMMTNSPPPQ